MAQAEQSPWVFPPALFQVPVVVVTTPSMERAREALREEGSVLDVGCGGGAAAFALVPEVRRVIGVDREREMLEMFAANAQSRGIPVETIEGSWPEVAPRTKAADVVVAHHVVYNVSDVVPFLEALDGHARSRVVVEMTTRHPLISLNEAWRHFWGLERPSGPTSDELMTVLDEMGFCARGAVRGHDVERIVARRGRKVCPNPTVLAGEPRGRSARLLSRAPGAHGALAGHYLVGSSLGASRSQSLGSKPSGPRTMRIVFAQRGEKS